MNSTDLSSQYPDPLEGQDKSKLTSYRVTPELIEGKIIRETYTMLPSGKVMVCELTLQNGFTVRGEAAVVDKANFIQEVGEAVSKRRAMDSAFMVEGYLCQQRMYEELREG